MAVESPRLNNSSLHFHNSSGVFFFLAVILDNKRIEIDGKNYQRTDETIREKIINFFNLR